MVLELLLALESLVAGNAEELLNLLLLFFIVVAVQSGDRWMTMAIECSHYSNARICSTVCEGAAFGPIQVLVFYSYLCKR